MTAEAPSQSSRFRLTLRQRVTVVQSILIGAVLVALIGWWLTSYTFVGLAGEMAIGWLLLIGVGVGIVATAGGALLTTLTLSPLHRIERSIRRASTLHAVSTVVETVADAEIRNLLAATVAAARAADARSRAKHVFHSAVVHDLKARLTGLALITDPWPEAGSREHGMIRNELVELSGWLRRVLEALRLDQLSEIGMRIQVDLRALIEASARDLKADRLSSVRIIVEGDAIASVDPDEMSRAMANLVSNAARAARSAVYVQVFPGLVRISDDGSGLPRPFEVLVEPLARATDPGGRPHLGGAGLGLFISKRILELHGGRLVCERTGPSGTVMLAYLGRDHGG